MFQVAGKLNGTTILFFGGIAEAAGTKVVYIVHREGCMMSRIDLRVRCENEVR